MNEAAQPLRLELARRGEALLASQTLPEPWKGFVRFHLNHAFGARAHLAWGVLLVPFAAVIVLFSDRRRAKIDVADAETKLKLIEFCSLADEIAWINNPILKVITTFEFNVILMFASIIRIIISKGMPNVERGVVIEVVREWETTIGEKLPFGAA